MKPPLRYANIKFLGPMEITGFLNCLNSSGLDDKRAKVVITRRSVVSLKKNHRLYPRNFKALSAAHVLALNEVIPAQHVRSRLGKARSIMFVGRTSQRLLLRA